MRTLSRSVRVSIGAFIAISMVVPRATVASADAVPFNIVLQSDLTELGTFIVITSKEDELSVDHIEVNRGNCQADHIYRANPPNAVGDLMKMATGGGRLEIYIDYNSLA